jgi:[calcium/calmodulin-dependent protein kinase] kinase
MEEEEVKSPVIETDHVVHGRDSSGHPTLNQYTVIRKLGEGAYGKVKLVQNGEEFFAVKVFSKSTLKRRREFVKNPNGGMGVKDAMQDVMREIAIMKKLSHPNIIGLWEVIDDDE